MKKIILLVLTLMLCISCTMKQNNTIYTNKFYQESYSSSDCYKENNTFSQIILCLQEVDKKEKTQNYITNNLLDSEK